MRVWIVLFTNPACATECAKIKATILDAIRPEAYSNVQFLELKEEDQPIFMDDLGIDNVPALAFFRESTDVENLVIAYDPVQADSTDVGVVRDVLETRFGIQNSEVGGFQIDIFSPKKSWPWLWVLLALALAIWVWRKFKT